MTPRERAKAFLYIGPFGTMYHNVEAAIDDLTIEFEKAIEAERESCAKLVEERHRKIGGAIDTMRTAVKIRERTITEGKTMKPSMTFSEALQDIKEGKRVARSGWNGKGMFIFLVPGSKFKVNRPPLLGRYPEGTEIDYHAHINMKTADEQVVPWLCSQTDMLADDWSEVEDDLSEAM